MKALRGRKYRLTDGGFILSESNCLAEIKRDAKATSEENKQMIWVIDDKKVLASYYKGRRQ